MVDVLVFCLIIRPHGSQEYFRSNEKETKKGENFLLIIFQLQKIAKRIIRICVFPFHALAFVTAMGWSMNVIKNHFRTCYYRNVLVDERL